jgi:hypothetical protein
VRPAFYANWIFYAYLFVWLPFAASTALYAIRSPWRARPIGRALMALLGSLTAILSFVLVAMAMPLPREVIDVLRGLTLGSVGLAGWMILRQIHVLQGHTPPNPCPGRRATDNL